jgi:hypothetical protein
MPKKRRSRTHSTGELFVRYHGGQIVGLGIFVWLVVFSQAFFSLNFNHNFSDSGQVKGAAIKRVTAQTPVLPNVSAEKKSAANLVYQQKIKSILENYFQQRAAFDRPHRNWLLLIDKTRRQLLALNVPVAYRSLHVRLITLLADEKQAVYRGQSTALRQVNRRWQKLLNDFFWLNN